MEMKFILLLIFYLNIHIFKAYELINESNKTILFEEYYNKLLITGNKTTSQLNEINTEFSIKKLQEHDNLHIIKINGHEEYFQNNDLNLRQYCTIQNYYLNKLKIFDLSGNNLKNITILRNNFCKFESLKYLDLSYNKIESLNQYKLNIFKASKDNQQENITTTIIITIKLLKLDHNEIVYIKSDTFKNFINLKYLDLSFNKLKYLHPMSVHLEHDGVLDLSNNYIQEIYRQNYENLRYLYLNSDNLNLNCDCLLTNLLSKYKSNEIFIDNFKCNLTNKLIEFKNINQTDLDSQCANLNHSISYKIEEKLKKSTKYTYLAKLAHQWFTWYIFPETTITDVLPKIPLLLDNNNNNNSNNETLLNLIAYRLTNINISCQATEPTSIVLWKTPFGYFLRDQNLAVFHKMSNLTKIIKYLKFKTGPGPYSGANTENELLINNNNELILTNFRQIYTGNYTCIVLNPLNYDMVTFNINTRVGVSDYFLYCLVVSIISSLIPSIIGVILCIICERQALDNFPMTPPVFPTPFDTLPTTPPNFDFNQWMTNTASNIQGTLDQASKKLRKGLEKASVTVKSIGVTSTAYFYSVYEQSSQRLNTFKSYKLPTLPTVTLPTMRYSNQLVTRMGRLRTGVADVLLQFREFCGSSDLTHTASIATIESDTNASNAVGYIVGKLSHMERSMNFIAEEGNINESEPIDAISVYNHGIVSNR
jgi:hypothetical protein